MIWDVLDAVGSVLFVLDAAGLLAFVLLYWRRSAWQATAAGRLLLRFLAVVAVIMVAAVLLPLVGNGVAEYLRIVLRVVLYGLLFGGIVHLLLLLRSAQRRDQHVS